MNIDEVKAVAELIRRLAKALISEENDTQSNTINDRSSK